MFERASDRWVSIILSVLLHGSLLAALVYGFWTYRQSHPSVPTPTLAIEATVVDSRSVNAGKPAPQPPAPQPPPPPAATEPVEPTGPPEPTPEELAQREQAQKQRADEEQAQKEQAQREAAQKQRQLDEQKQQQEEARRQAEEKRQREAQVKADAERKAAEAKKKAEEQRLAEQKEREAQKEQAESEAELRNSLAAEEHVNQLQSSGALASWTQQISARIHRAWLQPPSARSGLQCLLLVTQAPGGAVVSAKLETCNGDQAVRESLVAAAYRASPLPPPPDPSLFEREVEVTFRLD